MKLDKFLRPYYLMACVQMWLNLVLNLTTSVMGVIVLALALSMPDSTDPGFLGIALTSVLGFNSGIRWLIRQWTNVETALASVTRTREFEDNTPSEEAKKQYKVSENELASGDIQAKDLSVKFE